MITTPEQMREAAMDACKKVADEAKSYGIPQMTMGANTCYDAIRAIPIAPQPATDQAADMKRIAYKAGYVQAECGLPCPSDIDAAFSAWLAEEAPQPVAVTVKPLDSLRAEHAEWSQHQFGDVSAIGPAKHLAKEALEVADAPSDVIEHADCWMLLWDMQRRAGISDADLAAAISQKLAINKARVWPAPKEGEAREHKRDEAALTIHPADIVPDARDIRAAALREAVKALRDWQDNLILCGYKEAPVTVGMAADVVLALIDKEPTK